MLAIILVSSITSALIGPHDSSCNIFDDSARQAQCERRAHVYAKENGGSLREGRYMTAATMMAEPTMQVMDKIAEQAKQDPDALPNAVGGIITALAVRYELTAHPYSAFSLKYKAMVFVSEAGQRARAFLANARHNAKLLVFGLPKQAPVDAKYDDYN